MRSARLPAVKTLADFDFSFQPSVKREQIDSLHTLGFLERKENVVLLGRRASADAPGAVARRGRRPERTPGLLHHLADLLHSARRGPGGRTPIPRPRTLVFPSLMVIDEIGYPDHPHGAMLFFQLLESPLRARLHDPHQQQGFEDWGEIFGDDVMAAALVDRLVHHCHIVNIRGQQLPPPPAPRPGPPPPGRLHHRRWAADPAEAPPPPGLSPLLVPDSPAHECPTFNRH
ncbi:MAG: ATP-binding protein [Gemmatimonadetes bacterium]|nr:ATP-binding protein [Gemmatimonadota bacterium]